jgi:acyl-CoA synthetase (AMP-forming)/AMP-acid ligase II
MNLTEILPKAVKSHSNKKAIVCKGKEFTYKQFYTRVAKLANVIQRLGISKNDKIAILHKNCHYFLECYFSTIHTGAILVPINHHISAIELAFILENSEVKLILTNNTFLEKIKDACERINKDLTIILTGRDYDDLLASAPSLLPLIDLDRENIAQIYYTSGTTGRAKGVMLSHKNVYVHATCTIEELNLTSNDVWLHAAPLFHLADAWATWAITMVGGIHVLQSDFEPKMICKNIQDQKVTLTNLIPTMYYRLVNYPKVHNFNYLSLRVLLSGGAPISPKLVKSIIETFKCDYIQTYGMTETSPFLTMSILKNHLCSLPYTEQLKYKSTTGRTFKGVKLKVINNAGKEIKYNNSDVGEIIVKGDTITPGYWKLPEDTQKAFKNGWFFTGDMAVINKEGYLTIVDRKKDMIITGGENVYSIEVENILYTHPSVLEAAVIGIPDEEWGENVIAFIVRKEGKKVTEDEIIKFCKTRLTSYKVPKFVIFLEDLPKLGSGKISKKKLKNLYNS